MIIRRQKNYSENPEQKEFASVRGIKKLAKASVDAAFEGNRKEIGKLVARANRQGLAKSSEKLINSKGFDKIANGSINHAWRKTGNKGLVPKEIKDVAREQYRNASAAISKRNITAGNKQLKLDDQLRGI